MFDFNDAKLTLTADFILNKVSDYEIFKKYCNPFKEINKPFCSELRTDNSPDCRIYFHNNVAFYKDFATGEAYNCFGYIMKKYNCSCQEAFNIIAGDFNLVAHKTNRIPIINDLPKELKVKKKAIFDIITRDWEWYDKDYWFKYQINKQLLKKYNVSPCKYVIITKDDKRSMLENKPYNPIYSYKFPNSYKIYIPKGEKGKRFYFNGSVTEVEGFEQLEQNADLLVITKALKDVMIYKLLNINAISLQGEQNPLVEEIYLKLKPRFKQIIVNFDNDLAGIEGASKICLKYGFKSFIIPLQYESKDISDLVVKVGLNQVKRIIEKEIEICMNQ